MLAFNTAGVRYLVVGAYAVAAYATPRATGDIDLWVDASPDNAEHVFRALISFGSPMDRVDEHTFHEPNIVFQIGEAAIRVDILRGIDGVSFGDAWPDRVASKIGIVPTHVIGRLDVIANKRSSRRPKDLADLDRLERDI